MDPCFLPNITGCIPIELTPCEDRQHSNATIEWDIPANQEPGLYRLQHHGDALTEEGDVVAYTGTSSTFAVGVLADAVTYIICYIFKIVLENFKHHSGLVVLYLGYQFVSNLGFVLYLAIRHCLKV